MLDVKMEALGAVGFTVQFADAGGRALLGMIQLLKDLKDTPKQMAELLEDLESSVQRMESLKDTMRQSTNLCTHLSITQIQRVSRVVDDAYQATLDLSQTLEPLFQRKNMMTHGLARKAWRSVVSVQEEKMVTKRTARIKRLNSEVLGAMQLVGLEVGADIMCSSPTTGRC